MSENRIMMRCSVYMLLMTDYEKCVDKESKAAKEIKEKADKIFTEMEQFERDLVLKKKV